MTADTGLDRYDFVYNQYVELELPGQERVVYARVLDVLPDAVLLRLGDDESELEAPPAIHFAFGHKSWFYRAPVEVKAVYGPCWFISTPDPTVAEKVQRRRFVRIQFAETFYALDTNVLGEPLGEPFGLRIENISASGCYAIPNREDCAEYLMILLSFVGMPATYVVGRVIHRKRLPDGQLAFGISFDGIPHGVQDDLARVINDEIRLHLKTGQDITV